MSDVKRYGWGCRSMMAVSKGHYVLHSDYEALERENAALRTTLSGRTYCHSDEAVEEELTSLRGVVEKVRIDCEGAIAGSTHAAPGTTTYGVAVQARCTLALLPEVPK